KLTIADVRPGFSPRPYQTKRYCENDLESAPRPNRHPTLKLREEYGIMGENPRRTGRCLCGAVRYKLESAPFDAGYCHCRICQLASGAPVMAFATVPRND